MCGRYYLSNKDDIEELNKIIEELKDSKDFEKMKRGEIYPTNKAPILLSDKDIVKPKLLTWGFPRFNSSGVVINARAETARDKRMFSSSLLSRRCIIPSSGFYEWDKNKRKFLFKTEGEDMLYMAGIYSYYKDEARFVILTTSANASMEDIHTRMPVIINKKDCATWLFESNKVEDFLQDKQPLLKRKEIMDKDIQTSFL